MRARRSIDERASELMPVPYQQLSAIAVVDGDAAVRSYPQILVMRDFRRRFGFHL